MKFFWCSCSRQQDAFGILIWMSRQIMLICDFKFQVINAKSDFWAIVLQWDRSPFSVWIWTWITSSLLSNFGKLPLFFQITGYSCFFYYLIIFYCFYMQFTWNTFTSPLLSVYSVFQAVCFGTWFLLFLCIPLRNQRNFLVYCHLKKAMFEYK